MKVRDVVVWLTPETSGAVVERLTLDQAWKIQNSILVAPGSLGSLQCADRGVMFSTIKGEFVFVPMKSIAWVEVGPEREQT